MTPGVVPGPRLYDAIGVTYAHRTAPQVTARAISLALVRLVNQSVLRGVFYLGYRRSAQG